MVYEPSEDGSKMFVIIDVGGMVCVMQTWSRERGTDVTGTPVLYGIEDADMPYTFIRVEDTAQAMGEPSGILLDAEDVYRRLIDRIEPDTDVIELMCNGIEPNHGFRKVDGRLRLLI
jgi:hypothetical protein